MKKFLFAAVLLAFALLCFGCNNNNAATATASKSREATTSKVPSSRPSSNPSGTTRPPVADVGFTVAESVISDTLDNGEVDLLYFDIVIPAVSEGKNTGKEAAEIISSYYFRQSSNLLLYGQTEMLEQAREEYEDSLDFGFDFSARTLSAYYDIERNDDVIFSVVRVISEFNDEKYANTSVKSENFLSESGALLTMEDLFSVDFAEYNEKIRSLVWARISSDEVINYYSDIESGFMDHYNYTDFAVGEDSVTFFWQANTIAPLSEGARFFSFSFEELGIVDERWTK